MPVAIIIIVVARCAVIRRAVTFVVDSSPFANVIIVVARCTVTHRTVAIFVVVVVVVVVACRARLCHRRIAAIIVIVSVLSRHHRHRQLCHPLRRRLCCCRCLRPSQSSLSLLPVAPSPVAPSPLSLSSPVAIFVVIVTCGALARCAIAIVVVVFIVDRWLKPYVQWVEW